MRAIERRLEQAEQAASAKEPAVWLRFIEPMPEAPPSEWDDFRTNVARAESEGKNLIIHRII